MADKKKRDTTKLGMLIRRDADEANVGDQFAGIRDLTTEQALAKDAALKWYDDSYTFSIEDNNKVRRLRWRAQPVFTLAGYAGTGKTTTLGWIARELCRDRSVACCAPTGKAATVFSRSLRASGVDPSYCGTVHRMMYRPKVNDKGVVTGWMPAEGLDYDLIIVDEASMLSNELLDDLLRFRIPILAVGDHGQLPPVGEDVSLMSAPDVRLEEVHRQALDNPVIAFSMLVRQGGDWRAALRASRDERLVSADSTDVPRMLWSRFRGFQDKPLTDDPMVMCGTNKVRRMLNTAARQSVRDHVLVQGERLICLKNEYLNELLLANGFRGRVLDIEEMAHPKKVRATISFPDEDIELQNGLLCKEQLGAEKTFKTYEDISDAYHSWDDAGLLFDYGYALTVHKAQGSQADEAIVYVENFASSDEEFRRWLYTAATRASKKLTVAF